MQPIGTTVFQNRDGSVLSVPRYVGDRAPRCGAALGIGECDIRTSHLCAPDPDSVVAQYGRLLREALHA